MSWMSPDTLADTGPERRSFFRLSIGSRLALWFTLSAFVILATVIVVQYRIMLRGLEWDENQLLTDKVKMFESTLRTHGDNPEFLDHEVNLEGGAYWPDQHYVVYSRILDERGNLVIETSGMAQLIPSEIFPLPLAPEELRNAETVHYRKAPNGRDYFLLSAWTNSGGDNGSRREIQVAMDETGERGMIAAYRRDTLLLLALGTMVFAAAGVLIVRRCLRPVQELAESAERITANDMTTVVDPDAKRWPRELTTLAKSIYRMLRRLESSYKRCSQCAEDMAHELRNPIHTLMGETEVVLSRARGVAEYRHVLESSLEEYTRLSRFINELLFIARADNPETVVECFLLNVHSELERVREFHDAQAQEQGVTINCVGQAQLNADPLLLRRAVSNLVSNALSHTPRGGRVSLEVIPEERDGMVHIVVRDTGEGINAEDLPRIFDRFYRSERKRFNGGEGTGLGLAIVKSIMTLHRGSVSIESAEGNGTTVVLRFPSQPGREDHAVLSDAGSVTMQTESRPVSVYTSHPQILR
jgi:two-component system heavy metal sensor histidine kinase CusS